MTVGRCRSCGEPIDAQEYVEAQRNGSLPGETRDYTMSEYCCACFCELGGAAIPRVTDPTLPAPHTGLTLRQRHKLGKTDGG
jgi:hypothetical protein